MVDEADGHCHAIGLDFSIILCGIPMENYKNFDDLDELVFQLKKLKVRNIILAIIDEIRPRQVNTSGIEVGHCKKTDVLAYHENLIYKHTIADVDPEIISAKLSLDDFKVSIRSRNIG